MKDVRSLVETARDASRSLGERHDAFAELVASYQDMAFGCAYAVLGDFYLAEDAAQEAFVSAWQTLHQLRVPEAFSGWLRRIVLTRCNRLTRGQRLQIVPLELGTNAPSPALDPQSAIEQLDMRAKVRAAIQALPDKERLVTTLFYVNGYTQTDIGEFLEVPLTTVTKRLYSARQHLKKSAVVEMFKKDLQRQRPSRNDAFAEKVNAKLRPLSKHDWTALLTIASAVDESHTEENELWLRRRQQFDESLYIRRHYVAEHAKTGQLLGYGSIEQSIYLPRYKLILVIEPQWLRRGVGDRLLERLTNDLREVGAITATFRDYESSSEIQSFLKEHGFTETLHLMDLRLDIKQADLSAFLSLVAQVKARRISISTLAEEREHDPRYVEKLYKLTNMIELDDPARDSLSPASYYEREARLWLEQPYVLPDGYFIAKDGHEYVGVTNLNRSDARPGGVSIGFTGVKREYRRQGIATALKVCAIEWARKQGFKTIRALLQPVHSSLLTLNERLGFRHRFSYVTLEKCMKETVRVEPQLYDEYAGSYQDVERRPDLVLTVKNESGRLTAECIGQKVELFAESESRFFCKPFYGEFTFVRGDTGKITHVDSRVRSLNQPESILHARKIN